jgi:large subunit ribosomal protein L3
MAAILGKKIGMAQIFSPEGKLIPVTAIEAGPCLILAIKDKGIQIGFDSIRPKSLKKPLEGYFKKLAVAAKKIIREVPREPGKDYKVSDELKVDIFQEGEFVDVRGISKGKGFQGGMKRWNWKGGPMTHGSTSHRRVGSIGSTTTPGRVWKGHHMPGHMGQDRVTVQNLQVVKVDAGNNILLVDGPVPGCKNSYLLISKAKKKDK